MLEQLSEVGTGLVVLAGLVFGSVVIGLGLQFAANLSRNMSLVNKSATQGLKDKDSGG